MALILSMASLITKFFGKIDTWRAQLLIAALQVPVILLVTANNLSSGIILLGIVFIMIFVASRRESPFFL